MKQKFKWWGVLTLSLILLLSISFCGIKFIKHEKSQQDSISSLEDKIERLKMENVALQDRIFGLESKVNLLRTESKKSTVNWNPDDYNYLAIGNSITIHPLNEYWWNECGMAATSEACDYVHRVTFALDAKYYAYNFYTWEMMGHDRGETLSLLDGLLSDELDLVTIQLSENASDLTTFESDFKELIRYVQKGAPDAQVLVIGDFWDQEQKDEMKQQACEETGVQFISLNEIKGLEQYQCGMGTIVFDNDSNPHTVEHLGVAGHPGDEGMKWIAEKIIEEVKE